MAPFAAAPTPTPSAAFDLSHPLEGWHRTVDPLSGVVLWLPADWGMFTTPDWVDYTRETVYERYGHRSGAAFGVNQIAPVDLARDPRDPYVWQTTGRATYPTSTYTLTIASQAILCARYEYQLEPSPNMVPSAAHVCVVPSSSSTDYAWGVWFYVRMEEEPALLPLWPPVVASFVLEKQPE